MIQKPEWIPCITGKALTIKTSTIEQNKRHLISVSPQTSFIKALDLTIVDCRTYGLKKNTHIDPVTHYLWYIDFVKEHCREEGLVFVAPDADWLGKEVDQRLADKWVECISAKAKCLVVPDTSVFHLIKDPVGYAVRLNQGNISHPKWTHSFTRYYDKNPKQTQLWTYDSVTERRDL